MIDDIFSSNVTDFFDENRCREWVFSVLHPAGPRCASCGAELFGSAKETFLAGRRASCGQCGARFTALSGTPLLGVHFDFRQMALFLILHSTGMKLTKVAAILGCSPETARGFLARCQRLGQTNKTQPGGNDR